VKVKVLTVDPKGRRIGVSMKATMTSKPSSASAATIKDKLALLSTK
jgi:hypothetical protein